MTAVEIKVKSINMGDVEDPDLFIAQPIYEWQQTPAGKWVMDNSNPKPLWKRNPNQFSGWTYEIFAYFTPEQRTYWTLKFE